MQHKTKKILTNYKMYPFVYKYLIRHKSKKNNLQRRKTQIIRDSSAVNIPPRGKKNYKLIQPKINKKTAFPG